MICVVVVVMLSFYSISIIIEDISPNMDKSFTINRGIYTTGTGKNHRSILIHLYPFFNLKFSLKIKLQQPSSGTYMWGFCGEQNTVNVSK